MREGKILKDSVDSYKRPFIYTRMISLFCYVNQIHFMLQRDIVLCTKTLVLRYFNIMLPGNLIDVI